MIYVFVNLIFSLINLLMLTQINQAVCDLRGSLGSDHLGLAIPREPTPFTPGVKFL